MKVAVICVFAVVVAIASIGFARAQATGGDEAQQRRAKLRIGVQKICPVSGETLSTDAPHHTLTDPDTKEVLYVCCKNCTTGKPKAEHLAVIATNLANAQKHCLVMKDNEISAESKTAIINGQRIYICCPPCTRKMAASPEAYLMELDRLHEMAIK